MPESPSSISAPVMSHRRLVRSPGDSLEWIRFTGGCSTTTITYEHPLDQGLRVGKTPPQLDIGKPPRSRGKELSRLVTDLGRATLIAAIGMPGPK